MRILTRYILREVLSHAAIGVAVFTFVIFMRDLGKILELVVRNSAPLPSVAEIFAYTLPTALTLTMPMGVLVGILIGLSRLAADSEITAMRATGIGAWRFVAILSIFVVGAWIIALFNNVILAPRAAASLARLQERLAKSQASFEVQPRVFYENTGTTAPSDPNAKLNYVLYVEDVTASTGASMWKGVFFADISNPSAPRITVAREGVAVPEGDRMLLHLAHGSQHETNPRQGNDYQQIQFDSTDIPIALPGTERKQTRGSQPAAEMVTSALLRQMKAEKDSVRARTLAIEFHRRIALPSACLVLALVGIPLGLSSKKGGKSTGFVLTIVLVFLYYFASLFGMSLARQGRVTPGVGMWVGNAMFAIAGLLLLWRVDRMPIEIGSIRSLWTNVRQSFQRGGRKLVTATVRNDHTQLHLERTRVLGTRFPLILDELILRDFAMYLGLILASFLVLLIVFTFFELLKDVMQKGAWLLVGEYLVNLIPYLVYQMAPLAVLLAVLVTFGLMQKSNEITAMKATGVSIYRIIVPVLVIAVLISGALFVFDQFYLPHANKRQDALRNQIKGKPAQTYLRPDRKWIFGEHSSIWYYEAYDSDRDRFGGISIFEFDPQTFALTRRIYAQRAHWEADLGKWVFEAGWARSFQGSAIAGYQPFDVSTFAELTESPAYFKKEVRQSSEMEFAELRRYIHDLQQSGFDTVRLRVQLQKKLAYPLITFVMAVLAIPFSLRAARRGALAGVATAIGIAIVYWVASGLFEAMGNANQLPAFLAAWAPDMIFASVGAYLILKVPT
jgi:LPS export ABC transporter permease LptG/LPS export ABC transporter permease LptF